MEVPMSDDSLTQRRQDRDRDDPDSLDEQILRDAARYRMKQQKKGFNFDRAICLGDIITVTAVVGSLIGFIITGLWFASAQNQKLEDHGRKIDTITTVVNSIQTDVGNMKSDVNVLKSQVGDIHDAGKK